MEKILFFITRQLCYNSANYFAQRLAGEFEKMDYECEVCEIPEGAIPGVRTEFARPASENAGKEINLDAATVLEQYIGKKYIFAIDFNSKLPKLVMDDGSYYLDNIDAPFYNFILDHPLYHHSTLDCRLKNYHVISVDKDHCEYVSSYYPHIKSVNQVTLGADIADYARADDRKYAGCEDNIRADIADYARADDRKYTRKHNCILFMGTYRNPDKYLDYIKNGNPIAASDMLLMIDIMKENMHMTIEDAYKTAIAINDRPELMLPAEEMKKFFALNMNSYYLVEAYIRNYHRKNVLDRLIEEGFPVRLVGDWWENYPLKDKKNVEILEPVAFADSYDEIAKCTILLDSSPFFKNGVHDRVIAGMANKTVVLTDNNRYKENLLKNNRLFSIYDEDNLCEKAANLLENRQDYPEIAYDYYKENYTWKSIAIHIISICYCD